MMKWLMSFCREIGIAEFIDKKLSKIKFLHLEGKIHPYIFDFGKADLNK